MAVTQYHPALDMTDSSAKFGTNNLCPNDWGNNDYQFLVIAQTLCYPSLLQRTSHSGVEAVLVEPKMSIARQYEWQFSKLIDPAIPDYAVNEYELTILDSFQDCPVRVNEAYAKLSTRFPDIHAYVNNVQPKSRFTSLWQRLDMFASEKQGWDGYHGIPASEQTVKDAKNFLELVPVQVEIPSAVMGGDGSVGIVWQKQGHYVIVNFKGKQRYAYMIEEGEKYDGESKVSLERKMPEKLGLFLKRYFRK